MPGLHFSVLGRLARLPIQGCRNDVERENQLQPIVKQAKRTKPFVPCCRTIAPGVDGQGHAADHLRSISDVAYFNVGLAFVVIFADLRVTR